MTLPFQLGFPGAAYFDRVLSYRNKKVMKSTPGIYLAIMAVHPILFKSKVNNWGVRYLMGENLEVVWAEFSTLS